MNILKKTLAPITDEAWGEIQEQAQEIFDIYLTGRKFVDIDGPHGLEMGAVSTGRLIMPDNQSKEGINYGTREVVPLIEIRKPFKVNLMELDNINRGAKDADLEDLENAAREIALFEEKLIYKGFSNHIKGLEASAEGKAVELDDEPDKMLRTLGDQVNEMQKMGVGGPYSLIVNNRKWKAISTLSKGYPLMKQIKQIIDGQIIVNFSADNSMLVTEREGDYELTIGQDMSIGFDYHDAKEAKLYFTESLAFRVLSPEAIRILTDK
ncbi:MAG TPA: family 1 encapsulin nanocompartment shell protein [Bacteroidales bacterium]|nr:family 1 encapsulin nanocompartment shell protein [Bacteroidales bacterium]